jgi:hypothetical protein
MTRRLLLFIEAACRFRSEAMARDAYDDDDNAIRMPFLMARATKV